ncbi:MAG TPA: 2OG-Fe(II) oxygenase [Burkholderiales bacterium]
MRVAYSAEFRQWLSHNLSRGCAEADLIAAMLGQGFKPEIAQGLLGAFQQAMRAGLPPPVDAVEFEAAPAGYQYETPRLPPGTRVSTPDREVRVLTRLEQPVLAVLEGVLSAEECAQVIEAARGRLTPSTVVDPATGEDQPAEYRDSEGMFFALCENPLIAKLDERISALMQMPLAHGEGLQVLRYGPGAQSTPHFDFLNPVNAANRESLARSGQRASTLVVYLNEVEDGGETVFPELGLAVAPRPGNAVYFEYANSLGQVDPLSVHAGAPVRAGEKWALTKWMRERPFRSA